MNWSRHVWSAVGGSTWVDLWDWYPVDGCALCPVVACSGVFMCLYAACLVLDVHGEWCESVLYETDLAVCWFVHGVCIEVPLFRFGAG